MSYDIDLCYPGTEEPIELAEKHHMAIFQVCGIKS